MAQAYQDPSWLTALEKVSESLRAPSSNDKVWKDECAFSFMTPESSEKGLFLNMTTFQSFSPEYVALDNSRTGNGLYLYMKWSREEEEGDESEKKRKRMEEDENKAAKEDEEEPTRLAIGVEGGFSPADDISAKGILVKEYGFAIYPDLETICPYPTPAGSAKLPEKLMLAADAVIAMDDASTKLEVKAWDAAEEVRIVSKFAENLPQLDNPPKISPDPKTWKCADSGMTENLWLNLSTGYIGSGRRNWDGSGGTGAALKHFEETGSKYPLCVKLGTITPDGTAEVYSYDPSEDCMVQDPHLGKHLKHFGIDIMNLSKTEKTMIEMEIELNKNLSLSAVLEGNEQLVECYGPENVGLLNLGNSCYCNSVLQVLFSLEPFKDRFLYGQGQAYKEKRMDSFSTAPQEPQMDLNVQFTKLAAAFADPFENGLKRVGEEQVLAVAPKMLKDAIAKGHIDFSGREQQDAREYFQYVLDQISRMDRNNNDESGDPGKWFSFLTEERLQCLQSSQVKYKDMISNVLMLSIPLEESDNSLDEKKSDKMEVDDGNDGGKEKEKVKEKELPTVSFDACLASSLGPAALEEMDDYLSPATNNRGKATKTSSMASYPKFLAVQLKRYVMGDNWVPKKLECKVPVPRTFDLSPFRGKGIQSNEKELPDAPAAPAIVPDASMLEQLVAFGFDPNGCKRALIAVKNTSVEQAMDWVLNHQSDPDFTLPPEASSAAGSTSSSASSQIDPASVTMLSEMGFPAKAAELALTECQGNLERAAEWLFSHSHELDSLLNNSSSSSAPKQTKEQVIASTNDSDSGTYHLKAFISHIGKTTTGGHYLCHINKNTDLQNKEKDDWVIFNDRKVAKSKNPPFEHGFMYVFERI